MEVQKERDKNKSTKIKFSPSTQLASAVSLNPSNASTAGDEAPASPRGADAVSEPQPQTVKVDVDGWAGSAEGGGSEVAQGQGQESSEEGERRVDGSHHQQQHQLKKKGTV